MLKNVSTACLCDPNALLATARGYLPIACVTLDDAVHTHTGGWRKVTQLHRRLYRGKTFKFWLKGLCEPIYVTADHPLRVVQTVKAVDAEHPFAVRVPVWLHAQHLRVGDRLQCSVGLDSVIPFATDKLDVPEFLGKWLDEDGGCDNAHATWKCTTLSMAFYLRDHFLVRQISGAIAKNGDFFNVTVRLADVPWLSVVSEKCKAALQDADLVDAEKFPGPKLDPSGVWYYELHRITRGFIHDETVYNVEVDQDHSYDIAGVINHNCCSED